MTTDQTPSLPDNCQELLRRMARLESAGMRGINQARRKSADRASYIPYEAVLWCQDHGLVVLSRAPFEIIDWTYFSVTPKGYRALGLEVPMWK